MYGMGRKSNRQVSLHVPRLLVQLKRWTFFVLWQIAFTAFSIVLIMGEDTLWKITAVDSFYTRINSNPSDMWTLVWLTGTFTGISLMILWNIGILGWLGDWMDANL